jgi:hypothetical protein
MMLSLRECVVRRPHFILTVYISAVFSPSSPTRNALCKTLRFVIKSCLLVAAVCLLGKVYLRSWNGGWRETACCTESTGHGKGVEQNIKLEERTDFFITERVKFLFQRKYMNRLHCNFISVCISVIVTAACCHKN